MGSEATGSALDDLIEAKNAEVSEALKFEEALPEGDVEKKFWQTEKARLQNQWWDLIQQADAQSGASMDDLCTSIPGKRKTSTSRKEEPEEKEGQKDRDDPEEKEEGKEEEEEDKEDPVRPCKMRRHTI